MSSEELLLCALALALMGGGCGKAKATAEPDVASGPRLVPWQLEAEGTAPLVLGIYDTRERLHCQFLPDSEGELRCLPEVSRDVSFDGDYLDAACTQPSYYIFPDKLPRVEGRIVSVPTTKGECQPERYEVGSLSPVKEGTLLYGGEPCELRGTVTQDEYGEQLRLGSKLPPERFATGTQVEGESLSERLSLGRIVGERDEIFDDALFDARWGTSCTLEAVNFSLTGVETGDPICVPPYVFPFESFFADEACEQALFEVPSCQEPTFMLGIRNTDEPELSIPPYELGEQFTGQLFVPGVPDLCEPYNPAPRAEGPRRFFSPGPILTPDGLASVSPTPSGSGRLRLRSLKNAAGEPLAISNRLATGPRYHDQETGHDCDPLWTPEGSIRCIPSNAFPALGAFFADPECSVPAVACDSKDCDRVAIVMDPTLAEEWRPTAIVTTMPADGSGYFIRSGVCTPNPNPTSVRTLGDVVPWSDFPALSEVNGRSPSAR